jgi:hypothetical protein
MYQSRDGIASFRSLKTWSKTMTIQQVALTIGGETKRSNKGKHDVAIDWQALPEQSQDFIIRYGLKQYLADSMASSANEAEAKVAIEERLKKLVSGDLTRTRTASGDKPDTVELRALKNVKALIRSMAKTAGKEVTKEQVESAAKLYLAGEKGKPFYAEAKRQLEAEAALAQGVADDEQADLLADLLKEA